MTRRKIFLMCVFFMTATAVIGQTTRLLIRNFTTRDGLASNVVNCGLQDRQGYLWFGTNHCLTRFDGHRFANFYMEENGERQIEGITHIVEDTTHNMLLMSGKDYRLLCFDLTEMQFVSAEGLAFPTQAKQDEEEQAFMVRARELGIDRGNRTDRRHDLHYVKLDDGREIFATIGNGFFVYEPENGHLQHYCSSDDNPIIESDYINDIVKDSDGGVWLLTTFAGVYRVDFGDEPLRTLPLSPNIRSFAQLDNKKIAVADMEGRVFTYDPDSRQSSLIFNEGHRAYATSVDNHGRLWIGTRGGGIWISEEVKVKSEKFATATPYSFSQLQSFPARQIYDIKFSRGGTIWIATLDGGLIEGHQQPDGTYFFFSQLKEEKIHELDIDLMGRLWMATENGIIRKYGQKTDTIFNKCKVVCICHSQDGIIWAGTNGYGLLKITDNNIEYIQSDNGLANNCVESVVCDKEGNVIVGTDQGVSIVSSADGSIRNLYSSQGLRANTYNENAILCSNEGHIFLGSLTGMVEIIDNRKWKTDNGHFSARPLITSIDVNDTPRYGRLTEKTEFVYNQNNLCFHFSSFCYQEMSSVIYSYWLEGIDSDWRPSTKESQALYTNLSPGHYRLHVRCRLAGTTWSEETVCDVIITQPWYWTWWARIFYLLIIVLFIVYELHQYQQRLSLRRQLDQRLTALYAVEAQQEQEQLPEEKPQEEPQEPEEVKVEKENTSASQKDKDFLDKLDHLILSNLLQTDLDVNFIAQEMCVSYSTLHRRIKSLTGMSANEYVRKHRLTKAMQLLRDGHNATEVAMQCGFNSPSYFTRCFKSEYGLLPSEV